MNYKIINRLPVFIIAIATGLGYFVDPAYYLLNLVAFYISLSVNYNLPGKTFFRRARFQKVLAEAKLCAERDPDLFGDYIEFSICEDDFVKHGSNKFFKMKHDAAEKRLREATEKLRISMGIEGPTPPPEVMAMIIKKLEELRERAKKQRDEENGTDNPGA